MKDNTLNKSENLNIEAKSQLAKLISTENITVQHNNVKTASFDVKNRILTLPIFKVKSGDVYDMLIAHECAHALWTPTKSWEKLNDKDFRAYVNVLEDCRIDEKIKKKYPGVVRNYMNAFEILDSQDFFGLTPVGDLNKNLMFIDKINLYFKSTFRKQFIFSKDDHKIIKKVKALKTFKDVLKLAEELYGKAKKEMEKLKKLPDFDDHPIAMNYDQAEPKEKEGDTEDGKEIDMPGESKQDKEEENKDKDGDGTESKEEKSEEEKKKELKQGQEGNPGGRGGDDVAVNKAPNPLRAITQDSFDQSTEKLLDKKTSYRYCSIPKVDLNECMTSYKKFMSEMGRSNNHYLTKDYCHQEYKTYYNWLERDYKRFKKDNSKTVMYLVKEFEMKKSASAYKRAATDKTGIIDPLKLRDYKFSEDIFKRLTVLPTDKNHGMMMLLDWSGSMSDVVAKTVHQLLNLVWFCERIGIPFEVYMFNDNKRGEGWLNRQQRIELGKLQFKYKEGDMSMGFFNLVNILSHRMKKSELDKACMYMYQLAESFDSRYNWRAYRRGIAQPDPHPGNSIPIPNDYYLSSTPLNESLAACLQLVPEFKKKYSIEKMTFITLTDGGSNGMNYYNMGYKIDDTTGKVGTKLEECSGEGDKIVIKDGKKLWSEPETPFYYHSSSDDVTTILLDMIRKKYGVKTVGFYILKDLRRWSFDRFVPEYETNKNGRTIKVRDRQVQRKKFLKDKSLCISKRGYNEYYLLNGKSMDVQQVDLSQLKDGAKKGDIRRLFSKSMSNRIQSRVVLNKFIEQVA